VTDAFEEVEEKLREERYVTLLKAYGPWAAAGLVAILAGVGAYLAFDHHTTRSARDHSDEFAAAQALSARGDLAGAKAAFQAIADDGPSIYQTLTEMELASVKVAEGDLQGAIAAFDAAAESTKDPIVRDSARLRAAYLVADTQDFQAVEARVAPLLEAEGPIRAFAQELLAIEAWEAGDVERARTIFQALSLDLSAPEPVRSRAEGLAMAVLGPPPETPAAPAAASTPAPSAPAAAPAP
jgi:hypothetical protein